MSDSVRDFIEHDKALCSQALDGNRELLVRAAEMIHEAEQDARRRGIPLDDSDV